MTRIVARAASGTPWFLYRPCGSVAFGYGGNHPVKLADAVHTAYLACTRKRPDQAAAALAAGGFVVEVTEVEEVRA